MSSTTSPGGRERDRYLAAAEEAAKASTTGQLAVLNPRTGAVDRKMNLGSPVLREPIAVDGMVYVITDDAQAIALR